METETKPTLGFLVALVVLCGTPLRATNSPAPVPTGTWAAAGKLSSARVGASTVVLKDGRVLIIGGDNGTGALASVDVLDTSGNYSPGTPMNFARGGHTATVLADGRVLVAGGSGSDGIATDTAEIYDPTANTWTLVGPLTYARSGHTASLLPDGTVLVAGGENSGSVQSTLEIFDPGLGTFSLVAGSLSSPREYHAAALLPNGQVLIAGGFDGQNALASSDLYDSASGTVSPGPVLSTPRQGLSATTQLDGKVLVAGGSNGKVDLASAEVFDPTVGVFALVPGAMLTAREGHLAFLLPNNNAVLMVGGTSNGVALASSELYYPWAGAFTPTGSMASARVQATGVPAGGQGLLLVAGGKDASGAPLASSELYGFATIKTDKTDYYPFQTVTVTGAGWQPGETVTLEFHENPTIDPDVRFTSVAGPDGSFTNTSFKTDYHDVGVTFTLTASGVLSQTQMTFTDAVGHSLLTITASSATMVYGGTVPSITPSYSGFVNGDTPASLTTQPTCTTTATSSSPASPPTYSSNCSGASSPRYVIAYVSGTVTINPAPLTIMASSASVPYGSALPIVSPIYSGFMNGDTPASLSAPPICGVSEVPPGNPAGAYATNCFGAADSNYTISYFPGSLAIMSVTPTVNVTGGTFTYDGNPHGATATATGIGGAAVSGGFSFTYTPGGASVPVNAGTYAVIVAFTSADPNYTSATGTGSITINPATPIFSNLSPSQSIAVGTASINLSGTITAGSLAPPTSETVSITINGTTVTVPIGANGNFATTFDTSTIPVSATPYPITYGYAGDQNFTAAADSSTTLTVIQANTTTALSSDLNPSILGQVVDFTATVTNSSNGGSGSPAGTVSFYDGTTLIGLRTLDATGHATLPTAWLLVTASPHSVTAQYNGSANFVASQPSPAVAQMVNVRSTSTVVDSSPSSVIVGSSSTATLTVTDMSPVGSRGTPGTFAPANYSLSAGLTAQTATLLLDGTVLIVGGTSTGTSSGALPSALILDPAHGTFSATGSLNTARSGHTANLLVNGKVLITGGQDSAGNLLASTELYDPGTGTFGPGPGALSVPRSGHTATLLPNGLVLIAGGDGSGSVELFDPAAGNSTLLTAMSVPRVGHTATLLPTGKILLAGGSGIASAELYDPTNGGSSTSTGSLSVDRTSHTATLLPDGNVLITGGTSAGMPVSTSELYDADRSTFNAIAGNMTTTRTGHTATPLNNGSLLIAGGTDVTNTTLNSIETYTPSFDPLGTVQATSSDASDVISANCILAPSGTGATACTASVATAHVNGGTHTLTGSYPGDGVVHAASSGSQGLTVLKASQVISFGPLGNRTYGDAPVAVSAVGGASGNPVTFSASPAGVCTSGGTNGSLITLTTVGVCTVTASQPGNSDYNDAVPVSQTFTVNKATLTPHVTASNKVYDAATTATLSSQTLSGTIGSDSVSLTVGAANFDSKQVGTGKTVTATGLGLSGAAAAEYQLSSTSASTTADITALVIAGSFIAVNKVYDATTASTMTSRSLVGVLGTDSVSLTGGTAVFADKNVGTGKTVTATGLSLTGADASNYALASTTLTTTADITPRTLTVSATGMNKVYDATTTATVTLSANAITGDMLTVAYASANFSDKNVGTAKLLTATGLTITGTDAGNYQLLSTTVSTTADITARPISVAADAQSKVYGDADPSLTYKVTNGNLVGSDLFTGALSRVSGESVGTYAIQQGTLTAGNNYNLTYVGANLTVTPRPASVSPAAASKTYGTTDPTLTGTLAGFLAADQITATYTRTPGETVAGGPYTISATLAPASVLGNYNVSYNTAAFSINPATLTITAGSTTFAYGSTVPAVTASYAGFVNGDTTASLTTPPTCTITGVPSGNPVGTYPTNCAGAVDQNYAITYVSGSATIQAVPLVVTASSATINYGQTLPAISATETGFVNGDTVASLATPPTCTVTVPAGSPAGTYATNCSGATANNYTISYVAGTLKINPVPLTITASSSTTPYGTPIPTPTSSYTGFVNGDTPNNLTQQPTCATTGIPSGNPVGTYGAANNCSGAQDSSYNIVYVPGSVQIMPVTLTITASSSTTAYGATVPTPTPSYSGFVNGDTSASLTTQATCATSEVPSGNPVGTYKGANSCSGATDRNYNIAYVAGNVQITPATLTITASSSTTSYGSPIPTPTPSYSGFVNGDTSASLTTQPTCATSGIPSGNPVGAYTSVNNCSGAADKNYNLVYVAGKVQITPATLTITASSGTMTYGGAVPAITPSYGGFVNGDTPASLTTQPACSTTATSHSAVSTYPSSCTGAVDSNYAITYVNGTVTVVPGGGKNGNGCVYALSPTAQMGIDISGVNYAAQCGAVIDSNSSKALTASGANISAPSFAMVGGDSLNGSNTGNTAFVKGIQPVSDPLANLPVPAVGTCPGTNYSVSGQIGVTVNPGSSCYNVSVNGSINVTFNPGQYSSITISGSTGVTFNPGLYIIVGSGGLNFGGTNVGATGVTFYLGPNAGAVTATGSNSSFAAPTTGTYAGILFFQNPSDTNGAAVGGSNAAVVGALYFPKAQLTYRGSNATSAYTLLVANTIVFSGANCTLNDNYSSLPGGPPF